MSRINLSKFVKKNRMTEMTACGCTIWQLLMHLYLQFKEGMTWDNYGSHWVIDHITPIAFFGPNEEEIANHYSNLQPLTVAENSAKRARIGGMKLRYHPSFHRIGESFAKPQMIFQPLPDMSKNPPRLVTIWDTYPMPCIFACGEWAHYQDKEAA